MPRLRAGSQASGLLSGWQRRRAGENFEQFDQFEASRGVS